MRERVLTVKQPWADLIMAGVKDVENRTWPVPSTLPQWRKCLAAGGARELVDADWPLANCCRRDGPFPFRLWIHAGASVEVRREEKEAWAALAEHWLGKRAYAGAYHRALARAGALLGSVTVTGCHEWTECEEVRPWEGLSLCSPWAQEPNDILRDLWHWTVADPVLLDEPIPMRGRQRLWTLPTDVAAPS